MTASASPARTTSSDPRFEELVEELSNRLQAGEDLDVEAFARAHPEHAERLRQVLPALRVLVELGGSAERVKAGVAAAGAGDLPGTLGDFRIVREVGRGGMGVVYEAVQLSLDRRVALKVLPFAATMDPRQLQRFQNEARAAAGLEHPHIVPVYGVGSERGVPFYAMKFIEGRPLSELIRERAGGAAEALTASAALADTTPLAKAPTAGSGGQDPAYYRRVAELGVQAAEALEYAHSLGVVHRDVKPANLLLDGRGKVWVADFGLAKLGSAEGVTAPGDLLGTLRYMSPEQALARHNLVDHRADIYALGATLYELLTLQPAVGGQDRQEILQQIAAGEPVPPRKRAPSVPADLEKVVLKAMAREPQERYAAAQELADDLRRWLAGEPVKARRAGRWERARRWVRRRPALSALLAVTALSVAALVAGLLWHNHRLRAEAEKTARERDAARKAQRSARRAVNDMYSEVARKWLVHEPGMTETQRDFLRKALEFYEELAGEKRAEPEERLETGIAYRRMARIRDAGFRALREAEEDYRRSVAVLDALAADFPDEAEYRRQLGRSCGALGHFLCNQDRPWEAEPYLLRALSLLGPLAEDRPDDPHRLDDLADVQESLAVFWERTGRLGKARDGSSRAVEVRKGLAGKFPAVGEYRERLALSYLHLASYSWQLDRLPEAERACGRALDFFESCVKESPTTPQFRSTVGGGAYNLLAALLVETGRPEAAEKAVGRSLEIRLQAARDFPGLVFVNHGVAMAYSNQGRVLSRLKRFPEAREAYRRALVFQEKVWAASPAHPSRSQELALMRSSLAWLLLLGPETARDPRQALPLAEKALELGPGDGTYLTARGVAQYRLGDLKGAVASLRQGSERLRKGGRGWVSDCFFLGRVAQSNARCATALNGFFLAMGYQRLGEVDRARDCWRQALRRWERQRVDDPLWAGGLEAAQDEAGALLGIKPSIPADSGKKE